MKYFFLSFFFVISLVVSIDSYADHDATVTTSARLFTSKSAVQSACNAAYTRLNAEYFTAQGCYSSLTWSGTTGSQSVSGRNYEHGVLVTKTTETFSYHYTGPSAGACPDGTTATGSECFVDVDPFCSATNTAPDCTCEADGLPKTTGQYTTCDRPTLVYCDFTGDNRTVDNCPVFDLPTDECPSDSTFTDGQCVNKCGINAHWNGFENKCQNNDGTEFDPQGSCPSGYTQNIDGVCAPNSCPPTKKLVDGVCVLDTDPQVDVTTETTTENDGTTVEVEVTVTRVNNADGSTSVTTQTTSTTRDSNGAITGVDSVQTETTEEPEEPESEVTGAGNCVSPPACSGDAIQCALLHSNWSQQCESADDKVENMNSCSQAFVCEGGVFQCAALENQHIKFCEASTSNLTSLISSTLPSALADASSTNSEGVLNSTIGSLVNVTETLGLNAIFETQGAQGACPAPYTITLFSGSHDFDYELFICPTIRAINPLVILFAMMFCALLIYRALEAL